ncbi:MAG: NUDIX domain-containing protein [Theionarchaea archaeon]|nr:NUDIX domain-containing protein [Theionarchaea archaeon]
MKEVVTAVLKRGDKILIVKRGQRVNTFVGKWSCISGRMESTPLESVLKEIQEETGIPPQQATLLKEGNPIIAEGENITFKVYPFLFEVETENITLNWENVSYRWIEPHKIVNFSTVPQLKEVIEDVFS